MSSFVNLLNVVYPVGSVYCSMNSTSPATLFGGTWEQVTSRFLYGSTSGKATGGSSSHNHRWFLDWLEWYGTMPSFTNNTSYDNFHSTSKGYGGGSDNVDYRVSLTRTLSEWNHTNSLANATAGTASKPQSGHMECKTTTTTTLPPYITCYMWYRTA